MSDSEGSSLELSWDDVEELSLLGLVKEEVMDEEMEVEDEVKEVMMDEEVEVEESPPIEITPLVCTWNVC